MSGDLRDSTGFQLSRKDRNLVKGAHPDLVRVIERAANISPVKFKIIGGARTLAKQKRLVAEGVSWTLNSRHLIGANGFFHAIDLVPLVDADKDGKISSSEMWSWRHYNLLAPYIKAAAKIEGVPLEWGGDWRKTKDGPHWQLPWREYPAAAKSRAARADEPANPETEVQALITSRNMLSHGTQGVVGGSVMANMTYQLQDAEQQFTAGTAMGYAIGAVMVLAALNGVYGRWDDAGKPGLDEITSAWRGLWTPKPEPQS